MVAGASHIRFWDFVLGTTLGLAPGIVAITLLEYHIESAINEREITNFLILAFLVGLVIAGALLVRRKFGKNKNTGAEKMQTRGKRAPSG
jgi:uncharacterized membrane protein YdjX (TVP38/TMEM64 family)